MTFNTGNPVGSTDARDLYDNAQNFDKLSVGPDPSYPDRLGVPRKSWAGMEEDFAAFLEASGFEPVVLQYVDGSPLTVDRPTQLIERVSAPGTLYGIKLPSSFPAILSGTWETDLPKLVVRVDSTLRAEFEAMQADLANSTDSAKGAFLIGYRGRTQRQKNDDVISVADYGATGAGDDTAAFNAACDAAGQGGQVYIPFKTFSVGATNDAKRCRIIGANTVMTGTIRNHSGLRNIVVNGFAQDNPRVFLPEPTEKNPMLVYRQSADSYYVMSRKQGRRGGAIIAEVIKGVTTLSNSLGGPAELLRASLVHNCEAVYAWRGIPTSTSGAWEPFVIPAANMGHTGANVFRDTTIQRSSSAGAYAEFNVSVERGNQLNVAIYGTAGGTTSAEILVDGVVVATVNPQTFANQLYPIPVNVAPGTRVVRVRNAAASGLLYVAGVNFHRIDQIQPRFTYDSWSAYRVAALTHYIVNPGANDYAIFDADAQLWGGSYHGGETAGAQSLVIGGTATSLVDLQLVATDDFYIRQITGISWASAGGGTLSAETLLTFLDGQIELKASFRPAAGTTPNIQRFHTGIHGINEAFNRIVFPRSLDIGAEIIPLGQSSKVVMRDSTSNAMAITEYDLHMDIESDHGGVYIHPAAGAYNKVYYPWVLNGKKAFTGLSFTSRRTFR